MDTGPEGLRSLLLPAAAGMGESLWNDAGPTHPAAVTEALPQGMAWDLSVVSLGVTRALFVCSREMTELGVPRPV